MKLVAGAVAAVATLGMASCTSADKTAGPSPAVTATSTTTVTATVTSAVATTTVTAAAQPDRTVDQAMAEGGATDWLKRLRDAGLGSWNLTAANDYAWKICDQLWVGGDYDKIIDNLSLTIPRYQLLAIYGVAVGYTCNQPPGAPPGYPK
jgi:hypothetical protein